MQMHVWIGKSRIAGKGLFAGQDIPKETIITRLSGYQDFQIQSAESWRKGMPIFALSTTATTLMAIH